MKRLNYLWFYLLLAITVYVIIANVSELKAVIDLAQQINPLWLLLALVCQFLTNTMAALDLQQILKALGYKFNLWLLHKIYFALTFVYHVLPFSGFTGAVYLTARFEKYGVPKGKGLSASILSTFTGYIAFFALLILSILYLIFMGSQQAIPYGQILSVVGGVALLFLVIDRLVVHRATVHTFIQKFIKRKSRSKRVAGWAAGLETSFDEMAFGRETFFKEWRKFILPSVEQFGVFIFDALTLYVLFVGFQEPVRFFPILLSVGLARFFGTISILPGGVGTYEVAQVVALHAFGVPLAAATLTTLLFRFLSYWLPIPIGLYYYRQLSKVGNV